MRFKKQKSEAVLTLESGYCGGTFYSTAHGSGEFCNSVKFR